MSRPVQSSLCLSMFSRCKLGSPLMLRARYRCPDLQEVLAREQPDEAARLRVRDGKPALTVASIRSTACTTTSSGWTTASEASDTRSPRRSPAWPPSIFHSRASARDTSPTGRPAHRQPDRSGAGRPRAPRRPRGSEDRPASTSTSRTITSETRVSSYGSIAVFARDVLPAARDLLGQDRALEQQHGDRIGGRRRGEQRRQQHADVAGQLDGEQGAGQRRAHGAAQHRGHAEQRPEARVARAAPGPTSEPRAPPRISSGASTPPDVPEASATSQITALTSRIASTACDDEVARAAGRRSRRSRRRARAARQAAEADHQAAQRRPPHPVDRQALEGVFQPRRAAWSAAPDCSPATTPIPAQASRPHQGSAGSAENGNSGPAPNSSGRQQIAVTRGRSTGMKLRGRHSNSSSSTASSTAATGVPKIAGHAGRGAGDQQRLALGGAQVEELGEQRADRARRS